MKCGCDGKHRRWCPNRNKPIPVVESKNDFPAFDELIRATMPATHSPSDAALDWQQQRELWNREGYCAREACGQKHARMRNSANNLLYCRWCAHLIRCTLVTFTQEDS